MPITKTEHISGTIYIIARDADTAFTKALAYLGDNTKNFKVHQTKGEADQEINNPYAANDADARVYAVTLDIQPVRA